MDACVIRAVSLYESTNTAAESGIMAALKYFAANPTEGITVEHHYYKPIVEGDNIESTVNATCDVFDAAVDASAPPHLILDATRTGIIRDTVKTFTKALALPTFSASFGQQGDLREWRDLTASQDQYLVQLLPPADVLVQAVRDMVNTQNITNAAVIYDDTFVMDHKYKSLLENLPCRHIITRAADTDAALRAQLTRLKEALLVYYFVVGSQDTIRKVLEAANAMQLFGKKYSWYAVTKEEGSIGCGCDNSTVVVMQPIMDAAIMARVEKLKKDYGLTAKPAVDAAFYFDFAVRGIKAIAQMVKNGKFASFAFVKCADFDERKPPTRDDFNLRAALKAVKIEETSDPIVWNGNGKSYIPYKMSIIKVEILKGKIDKVAGETSMGQLEVGVRDGVRFELSKSLASHQAITVYRVTTVEQPPFIMKRINSNGKVEFYGYCIDLIDEIRKIVNFEYEISEAPDGLFGTMNDKEEWNGMIKELIDKRAEIALAPLSVMAERENVVDFTVPYYDLVGITILMLKPKTPTSLFRFLTVLEPEVWGCILVAYAFTSVLLYIFDRFSPYSYQNNREKYIDDDEKREFSFKECLWFCMCSLTPQGGGEAPKNLSGRLVAATWWLFGFIIIASYTANLAAFLTVSRLDTPIESLDDLANQYKVQYAPMNGTSTMTYFQRMEYIEKKFYEIWKDMSLNDSMSNVERAKLAVWDYPVSDKYTKMWQSMQEAGLPTDFASALARVRASKSTSEGFAYLGDATDIRYLVLTNCDLQIVGEEFSRKPYAIAVQQGSPLKDQFNDAILKLLNQRKLETLKERWWNQNPEKKSCEAENDQSDGISIENIGGVFIVIFVGIGLACITLAFEYWWYRHRKGATVADSTRVVAVRQFAEKPSNNFSN
ncbi:Ionotropic receptor 25a [Hyalella azteca]|uniref:Ionotropic receptor 25a n=1 Tax=Hyalella azteca TaxID=294128 RepID=A0A6A0H374_HYAAZ|nr:Ionotropic receptor 25a [Hyalella azteca]